MHAQVRGEARRGRGAPGCGRTEDARHRPGAAPRRPRRRNGRQAGRRDLRRAGAARQLGRDNQGTTHGRNSLHLPLLRRRLRRDHRIRRRADHRRARRPRPPGQLRAPLHQGLDTAPHGNSRRSHARRGCCSPCSAPRAAQSRHPSAWNTALDGAVGQVRAGDPRPRARRRRLLCLGPAAHRGLLRLQQARQGLDRHQQHRHQLAPVHEQRGGRLQADAGRRCAARLLRRPEARRVPVHRGQQRRVGAPDSFPPHRGREGRQPGA